MKRNLTRHKAWENKEGFQWSAWQAESIRNIDRFRKENKDIMSEYVPVIDSEVEKLLQEQFSEGYDTVTGEVFGDTNGARTDNFFRVNQQRTQSLIDDVNNNMHVAESASLRMMDDVYRQTVYRAELAASTGSVTMEQAVDMAVKDFLSAGINCIQYKNGRMVNIATYAEMAIRTSSLRSYFRGEAQRREELGIDTVLVTQYGACSDTCLPWQGKVYIDDVWGSFNGERSGNRGKSINGSWYPLLSVAVDGGLFHPNCRHSLGTWREGIDKVPNPLDKNEVRRAAELEAKQRALERNIRKWKRLEEGSIYPEDVQAYKRKRLDAQKELREFIRENSDVLRRDYWREKTFGIPHEANKVADYENNQLKNQLKSGIITSGRDSMGLSIEIDDFTPCLVEKSTGKIVDTKYSIANKSELKSLKQKGWNFNWTADDLKDSDIYKLTLENDDTIQGLVALTDFPRDKAMYINIAESAPHNIGENKKYEGVGGHLFAIAAKESVNRGYDGYLFLDAKNMDLVNYYHEKFGATLLGMPHPYRMYIDEVNANKLLKIYTFKEE